MVAGGVAGSKATAAMQIAAALLEGYTIEIILRNLPDISPCLHVAVAHTTTTFFRWPLLHRIDSPRTSTNVDHQQFVSAFARPLGFKARSIRLHFPAGLSICDQPCAV